VDYHLQVLLVTFFDKILEQFFSVFRPLQKKKLFSYKFL